MAWASLFIAGLFEIAWAIGLKYTEGFSRLWPSVGTIVAMVVSVAFLEYAVRALPVGTAYAVWVGIGAVGTALLGMLLFGESREPARLVCLLLIVAGVVGLKLVTPSAS
jgi:quaternary ammonium compound-resistance protein SugE